MILDIDIGNTCLKWRLSDNTAEVLADKESGFLQEMLISLMLKVRDRKIDRVRLAHVLGRDREKEIITFFDKKINIIVECARSKDRCGEVINKYERPDQLGVDRWMCILAAFNHAKNSCCVIDCGSAITVDFVSSDGTYVGGYIAPGLRLLAESLSDNTKLLPLVDKDNRADISHGKSTIETLQNGVLLMTVSFIEKSVNYFNKKNNGVERLYLTGGDAELLMKHIVLPNIQITLIPSLVLDGLSIALP
jgi:type III pantothenate kinase